MWGRPPKESRRYGWCEYHRLWLTVKQARESRCLERECECFKKNENHQLWKIENKRTAKSRSVDNKEGYKV